MLRFHVWLEGHEQDKSLKYGRIESLVVQRWAEQNLDHDIVRNHPNQIYYVWSHQLHPDARPFRWAVIAQPSIETRAMLAEDSDEDIQQALEDESWLMEKNS